MLAAMACLAPAGCLGQQGAPVTATPVANPTLEQVKLFNDVRGFMAPILIPVDKRQPEGTCNGPKEDGDVKFSFIVDLNGRARNIAFEKALGNDVDYSALRIMENDRFEPAEFNGAPVASFGALDMQFESCGLAEKDKSERKTESVIIPTLRIQSYDFSFRPQAVRADGQTEVILAPISDSLETPTHVEKVGGEVTPPIVIHSAEAEFSDYARRHRIGGSGNLSVVVDEHGFPHDVQLDTADPDSKVLDPSLVLNAISAIRQYRFKPAMKNGMPVPVQIQIEVDFRLNVDVH
jgi:outer membrane biosynthesis protein TonB